MRRDKKDEEVVQNEHEDSGEGGKFAGGGRRNVRVLSPLSSSTLRCPLAARFQSGKE